MTVINRLTHEPFPPHPMSAAARSTAENNLAAAQANFDQEPTLENTIWLGRRHAYLFQYAEMFNVYDHGVAQFPDSHELLRHRGHRYISTRQFERAIADFEKAAELIQNRPVEDEPNGDPSVPPNSNSHFNIWYHLGLARYLVGDFEQAADAYTICMRYSDNADSICATADWHYMILRRLGRTAAADQLLDLITPDMTLVESQSYHYRLMMYKGMYTPEQLLNPEQDRDEDRLLTLATQGYGVGTWYLYNGDPERAHQIYQQIIETGFWAAFGYIAAETELLKLEH